MTAAAAAPSLSESVCLLSHCEGCGGPCAELVLPVSRECHRREGRGCDSGPREDKTGKRTDLQEEKMN